MKKSPSIGKTYTVKVKAVKGLYFDVKLGTLTPLTNDEDNTQSGITEDNIFSLTSKQEADEGMYNVFTYTVTVPAGSEEIARSLYIIKKNEDNTYTLDAIWSDDPDEWKPIGYKPGQMTEIVFSRK